MTYLIAFGVAFLDMLARSSQQMHVFKRQYVRIWLTAGAMAQLSVLSIGFVVQANGFDEWLALAYGAGWGLGSTVATMIAHRRRGAN